jgi:BirA family transcriptional regulator, biotin operon repressor / biotin---[acetyl-CoA-carboxylase] ligase
LIFSRHHFATIGSTNDEAGARARTGATQGTVIVADEQTAGRGRQGRTWHSKPGNLYTSIILRPVVPARHYGELAFVAALSLATTLEGQGLACQLKWPNDVLVGGAKISGLLLESEPDWVVLGMGVNIAHAPELPDRATTCLAAQGLSLTPAGLLDGFLPQLAHWYDLWQTQGFIALRAPWRQRAIGLGQPVRVRLAAGQELNGTFTDLDSDGALLLSQPGQPPQRVLAGDVFFS